MVPFSIQVARNSNYNTTIVKGDMWVTVFLLWIVSNNHCLEQLLFFRQKCMDAVFFPLIWDTKDTSCDHIAVVWSCNFASWGHLSFIWWVTDLFSCQDCEHHQSRLFHSHIRRLASAVALRRIRAGAKLSTSVSFTQTARQSIGTWFPHCKGGVNGAKV